MNDYPSGVITKIGKRRLTAALTRYADGQARRADSRIKLVSYALGAMMMIGANTVFAQDADCLLYTSPSPRDRG